MRFPASHCSHGLCTALGQAFAQESGLYAGPLTGEGSHSHSWSLDYAEGFGQYFAGSITITWLNQGQIPDGPLVQAGWGRRV